jgi:hypothetical protein
LSILHKITSLLLIALSIILYSCNTTEPDGKAGLNISLEDISCTEAWIRLTTSGLDKSAAIKIFVNDEQKKQLSINTTGIDTVLYIDSLQPNSQYSFRAEVNSQPFLPPEKTEVSTRTLDTTSHDFTWETFQFGDYGSSLYDVAIINSNDIWGVGEIYLDGETEAYNAVHWDGKKWKLIRIPGRDWGGTYDYGILWTVYAFTNDDVWFANSADLIQWNGNNFTSRAFFMLSVPFTGQVRQMWGKNSKNIYCAGNGGALYNYTGSGWKKIESGTDLNFYDIWGSETEILAVGSLIGTNQGRIILKIENQATTQISSEEINNNLKSIWFSSGKAYYAVSTDLYYKHSLSDPLWNKCTGVTNYAITSVHGNTRNDVFVSASYGDIIHYNGITWFSYFSQTNLSSGVFSKITAKGNIAAAVGFNGNKAVLTIGRRQ